MWMELLQWALPAGFLGSVITWLFSRSLAKAKENQQWMEAYNKMLTDQSEMLKQQSNENKKQFESLVFLRRALARCNDCRYIGICPVAAELRKQKGCEGNPHKRQYGGADHNHCEALEGEIVSGKPPP